MSRRFASGAPEGTPGMRFIALLAVLGVAVRVLITDKIFFRFELMPLHDMSQGLAFFTTSMHSVWLGGDIAWWSPVSMTGYPQYFQGFFAPLAPTFGHIAFTAWTHLVAVLATFGIHMPEYVQYLVMTYMVLPLLAFLAFGYFCLQVLRLRSAIALAMIAFVLSGIGLWNSAWFYFQEPASLFFFLGATLAVLRRPSKSRFCVWLAAILVQLASLNYWTVYNLPFVAIVLGTHAAIHPMQWRRAAARLALAWRTDRVWIAAAFGTTAFVAILWGALIGFAFLEQSGKSVRWVYGLNDALDRIAEVRRTTLGLFDPWLDRARQDYAYLNELHDARYIGMALLPLVLAALVGPWDRRMRWLLATAVLVVAFTFGSPYAMAVWVAIPHMNRIQHEFYFYTQYWQLLVVLLGAMGLEHAWRTARARPLRRLVQALCAAAGLALAACFLVQESYPVRNAAMQSNLMAAIELAAAGALLGRVLPGVPWPERRFARNALVVLLFLDLSTYFYTASRADMDFMKRRSFSFLLDNPTARPYLASAWPAPDTRLGFPAGYRKAMPLWNSFWPDNTFMVPAVMALAQSPKISATLKHDTPFLFYPAAIPDAQAAIPQYFADHMGELDARLVVATEDAERRDEGPITDGFSTHWREWSYNGFAIDVEAPRDGWLAVRQLYDASWRYTVDGKPVPATRANYLSTAIRLPAGAHRVEAEYRPRSRALYWWAVAALEIGFAGLLCLAWLMARPRPLARGTALPPART